MTFTPSTASHAAELDRAWNLHFSDHVKAMDIASPLRDDPDLWPHARVLEGAVEFGNGHYAEALRLASEALPPLRAQADAAWLGRTLNLVALSADALGQRDVALTAYQEALDLARLANDLVMEGTTLLNIGTLWFLTDEAKGLEYARASVDVLRRAGGSGRNLAHSLVVLGISNYQAGRHDEGVAQMEEGRDLAFSLDRVGTAVTAVTHLAQVWTERGDPERARRELREPWARFAKLPDSARNELLYHMVIVEHHAGEYERALSELRALEDVGLTPVQRQGMLPIHADCLAKLGRYEEAYARSQELVSFNEHLYEQERAAQLLKLEERHQAETARREAELRRLEAEAAQRDAELKHLENVELQRALEANALLIQSLRESHQVSETLLGVSHLMQLDLDPHDLARYALSLVTQVVDADWAALVRLVSHEVTVEPIWARHPAAATFTRLTLPGALDARHPLLHRSARSDEASFQSGYQADGRAHSDLKAAGLQGVASLPAGTTQATTYVLLLGRLGQDRRWTDREQHVLGATGRALRAAIETQEQTRRTREAALTDVLTGLPNRRAFEADLKDAAASSGFHVAMLDVDGLKRVNDTRGHAAGDRLLQVFGAALRTHAPEGVRVYRLGGDELALLISSGQLGAREGVEAQVRALVGFGVRALQGAGFPESGCSFGVADWPQEASTAVEAVSLADTRLYADKQARRGQAGTEVHARDREVQFGDAVLDVLGRSVRGELGEVKLTPREAEVLYLLASGAPGVVTRAELAEGVAGDTSGALDVHLSNLRRKLAGVTSHAGIRTVRGQGFSLEWYGPQDA